MKAHYIQHVPFEGLGCIAPWLKNNHFDISVTRQFAGDRLPDPGALDFLIVMGGPMGVNDQDQYPWIPAEKAFIKAVVESETPVLGICLGAQFIASAMGARVYQNGEKEIGWFPVQAATSGGNFAFPDSLEVFHWHGETFDLPEGAVHLARSRACENQAFQLGDRVLGLQFHLETTPDSAAAMVEHCGHELVQGPWIQSGEEILASAPERCPTANRAMETALAWLVRDQAAVLDFSMQPSR